MPGKKVSKKVRDALVVLVKGTGDVVASAMDVTRDTTAHTLRGISGKRAEASRAASEAIAGAIRAGSEAGMELGSVAKGAVIGAIQGVDGVTKVTTAVLHDAVRAAVTGSTEAGEDAATVARKAVEGAIEAGIQAGLKADDAASAAAAGAVEAAEGISEAAAAAVTRAVSGTISGVRVVLKAPFRRPLILAVDSNRRDLELLTQALEREGYQTRSATSLEELDQAIKEAKKISLALIDLASFDHSIWERCEELRKAKIPFLVISSQRSPLVQQESMRHGASGVLTKPLGFKEIVEYVRALLVD
jgi:CheY-like chemotaxis protein